MLDPATCLSWQIAVARKCLAFFTGRMDLVSKTELRDYHAAGILEQLFAESSFEKDVWGDNGMAYGLAQLHNCNSRDRLPRACEFLGAPIPELHLDALGRQVTVNSLSVDQQLQAIWHELLTTERTALGYILAAQNAYDAGYAACRYYERPRSPFTWARRGAEAQIWYDWLLAHPTKGDRDDRVH